MTAAAEFRDKVTCALSQLPFRSSQGIVNRIERDVIFQGKRRLHPPVNCWVYTANDSEFEIIFGFYSNFSGHDLICKTVHPDFLHMNGASATIQFNGNTRIMNEGLEQTLGHGFDFQQVYGTLGAGYAQVHHRESLANRNENVPTKLEDLAIVCANCHVMIHRRGQNRPLDTLIQRP